MDAEYGERSLDSLTDHELMAAHVAGHELAFTELVNRHRDRLWAVALRTTNDPEEAADGLQEALLSAYKNAASFRGDSQVTTWMHRVVVNACLDRLRRRSARPSVPLPEQDTDFGSNVLADPRDPLGARELRIEISRALAELPTDQRAAIVLVDVEGYSVEEAAQILECPSGTIKSRCARGRAKLATRLASVRNPSEDPGVGFAANEGGDSLR
jgi:RNA polymerase sigma-70 factor, ECF subfamily